MKALVKTRSDAPDVDLRVMPVKALPALGHARVEVAAAGICGTDLHIIAGEYSSRPPVTLGHEVSGTVTEVSADVDPAWLGAHVALETFFSTCSTCKFCRAGRPNLCDNRVSIGSGADGGFADSIIVPAYCLHRLPEGLDLIAAALAEPLACVCHSLFDPTPAVLAGDRAVVLGPGAVGLLAAQVARAAGAHVTIVGTERDHARLAVAQRLGLETIELSHTSSLDSVKNADVVIECSGSTVAMRSGFDLLAKRGRFVQVGQTDQLVSIPLANVSYKELSITGGFASTPSSWRRAMNLLERRLVSLPPLVDSLYGLEEWEAAFEALRTSAGVKTMFVPDAALRDGYVP